MQSLIMEVFNFVKRCIKKKRVEVNRNLSSFK